MIKAITLLCIGALWCLSIWFLLIAPTLGTTIAASGCAVLVTILFLKIVNEM